MNVTFSGGTSRQRTWFQEAMQRANYNWDLCPTDVTVQWVTDPPCSGHSDFACTQSTPGHATISIRNTLDSENRLDAPVQQFYQETCLHELGHVVMFALVADPAVECPWFFDSDSSSGTIYGTADDLNPLDSPWEDRIQEAQAETFKDLFLPPGFRVYDNRTNWRLDKAHLTDFTTAVGLTGSPPGPNWSDPTDPQFAGTNAQFGATGTAWLGGGFWQGLLRVYWWLPAGATGTLHAAVAPALTFPLPPDSLTHDFPDTDHGYLDFSGPPVGSSDSLLMHTTGPASGHMDIPAMTEPAPWGWEPFMVRPIVSVPAPPPPWPYADPTLDAGEGDWGTVRFLTY